MKTTYFFVGLLFISSILQAEETDQLKLLKLFREEFVSIKPGKFQMGNDKGLKSEKPVHLVNIKQGFFMAKYEVTQNLYEAVMGENPSEWKGSRNSVEMVSYKDAVSFCEKATKLLRQHDLITKQQSIQLPSEEQWEYCARAGTTSLYSFGDDAKQLDDFAWYTGNAAGNDPPVGAKKPNAWGLYDMHGYLWEWCSNTWQPDYSAKTGALLDKKTFDPSKKVLRGGSWKDASEKCTSSYRAGVSVNLKDSAVGFRCILK